MALSKAIQLTVASSLCVLVAACSQSVSSNSPAQHDSPDSFALQLNPDVDTIMLSGVFVAPQEWVLDLATPLLTAPQQSAGERYSIRINDATERLGVSVSEVSKGPLHFSAVVEQADLPIRQLTLFDHSTQLDTIENEHLLPAESDWMSLVHLAAQNGQLCLTWPDELFAQAALLSVDGGRLQLAQQSSTSPLCIDAQAADQMEWRVNLRNPMFAVQLITKP